MISSNEVSPKTFDPTRRLSRSDIMQGIADFRDYVKKNSDPNKQSLVILYYFGHGLADGMSKSVFFVPEQFVDDEVKHTSEVSDRLIDVAEINRQFSDVTDHSLFLIDACRAYKDQAKELIEQWKKTVKQGSDVSGILNAVQFASGIYGPTPMIFASDDGRFEKPRRIGRISGKHVVSIRVHMRAFSATGESLTQTRETQMDQCEGIRVN